MNNDIVSNIGKSHVQNQGEVTTERFVSFLDIMGFKDFIARNDYKLILEKLTELTDYISEEVGKYAGFHFSMFSDSILIYSDEANEDHFEIIVKISSQIVSKSISIGLPIKGAIAKGICTATTGEKLLYFGQPIIDAFKLEENIVIYGVAIHNTAEQEAIALVNRYESKYLYDYKVTLKSASSKHFILNWYGDQIDESMTLLTNIRKTVSDAPRRYIDNTIDAIIFLRGKN